MALKNGSKKCFVARIFGLRGKRGTKDAAGDSPKPYGDYYESPSPSSASPSPLSRDGFAYFDPKSRGVRAERPNLGRLLEAPMLPAAEGQALRVFVATWNVGGKAPHSGMNLDGLLPADDRSDIYVLGFQEIVPLNAGNVLVVEDNEPAVRWLSLINQALNRPTNISAYYNSSSYSSRPSTKHLTAQEHRSPNGLFFQKRSLKSASKVFRTETGRRLKTCNCPNEAVKKYYRESCFSCPKSYLNEECSSSEDEESGDCMVEDVVAASAARERYALVACKQMVGIFVSVWVRRELVQHIGHLRLSTMGRGIMGRLGNKGCISVSMSVYQTSFCFICSHLASGEKEGDELRRNSDVIEILKSTQFSNLCKAPFRRMPERIVEHDRVIWLGDLNYRISLSYSETRRLLQCNDWDTLLEKDQLKIERESGRVFRGWKEGKIYFAPTYKYSRNSDVFAGEARESKKKRTPAWCDRILWHGDGIQQLCYVRGESRFSDHRPVCAIFLVDVGVADGRSKGGLSATNMKVGVEELLPSSGSFSSKYGQNARRDTDIVHGTMVKPS